ncbi:hypothetical protein SS05631_c10110 [Sinorhizobium sp. CCBAU 05631]|nr:hypothetical protein SS05631_c10110 [Sinorhizobium sp. CCBAU 05631]
MDKSERHDRPWPALPLPSTTRADGAQLSCGQRRAAVRERRFSIRRARRLADL